MTATRTGPPRGLARKLSTYAASSVVATLGSEVTLVVCYGLLHLPTVVASGLGWLAGAVPNYWINRSWTWRRTGRPSLRREVAPHLAIVLLTLVIAVTSTHLVAQAARDQSETTRTTLVAGTFLGVYVAMFVVRYLLLDRLFARLARTDPVSTSTTGRTTGSTTGHSRTPIKESR